jgi:hypothetical protein
MHTAKRVTRSVKKVKKRYLIHLHGMRWTKDTIEGYVRGPKIEFQYSINEITGHTKIIYYPNITIVDAKNYLLKMEKEIMSKVAAGHSNFSPRRSSGMFYLQRSNNPTFTPAATSAIGENVLSQRFVEILMSWNLRVIQGR